MEPVLSTIELEENENDIIAASRCRGFILRPQFRA